MRAGDQRAGAWSQLLAAGKSPYGPGQPAQRLELRAKSNKKQNATAPA